MNNYKQSILLVIVAILSLTNITHQQCPPASDLLQSGITTIVRTNSSPLQNFFQFTPSFLPPTNRQIQAIASASSLQIVGNNGMDYSIVAQYNANSNRVVIAFIIDSGNSWERIQISYFISGRPEFFLGTFISNVFLDAINANGQSFSEKVDIANWNPSPSSAYKGIAQYSGIKTRDNSVTVSTLRLLVNAAVGELDLTIRISPASARVQLLYISYVVFVESAITSNAFNFVGTIPPSNYVFIGLESLNAFNPTYEGHSFFSQNTPTGLTCVGGLCTEQCITAQQCTNVRGVVSGNICYRCRLGEVVSNGQCVIQNQCNPSFVWNGVRCVCPANTIEVNNFCFASCGGANGYLVNGVCLCLNGFTLVNGQCISITCPPNSTPNSQGNCICNSGFTLISNQCVRICPNGQGISTINLGCIQCNALGSFVENFICRCSAPFFLTVSGCQSCPPNSQYDPITRSCSCLAGFQPSNGQCVRICTPPLVLVNGICSCPTGQALNTLTNRCIPCTDTFSFIQNNVCFCLSPYFMTTLGCRICPANSDYDFNLNSCVCRNGFQSINGLCQAVCPSGQILVGNTCVCPTGQGINLITNICIVCTTPGHFIQNNICNCQSAYFPSPTGCRFCGANSFFVVSSQTCVCSAGFYQSLNPAECLRCHFSCATCQGPSDSQCTSCPNNVNLINGQCTTLVTCQPGQFRNSNNVCVSCLANCRLCNDANSCQACADGFTRTVVGSVVSCVRPVSNALQIVKRGYVVGNGVIFQGISMNFLPVSILQTNCNICNSLFLISIVAQTGNPVATMEYVTNSQYWFIISFAFSSGIIPTFSFKVQINPIHANNFTPQEMALNVFGQISEATAYTETSIQAPQPPQPFLSQSATFGSGAGANGNRIAGGPSSTLVDASTLSQIFG